jgi:hypothetical protein
MGLNIKNAETEQLIRELAGELNVSLTAAVTDAVQARLAAVRAERKTSDINWDRVEELLAEMREMLGEEYLSQDFDELLYDEMGLPK